MNTECAMRRINGNNEFTNYRWLLHSSHKHYAEIGDWIDNQQVDFKPLIHKSCEKKNSRPECRTPPLEEKRVKFWHRYIIIYMGTHKSREIAN